MTLTVKLFET